MVFVIFGCRSGSDVKVEDNLEQVYLKNNIHIQKQASRKGKTVYRASYANYTDPGAGHIIAPVNTLVTIQTSRSIRGKGILITTEDGKKIHFEFNSRNMNGMQPDEYFSYITSATPTPIKKLSKLDRKGISEGKAFKGMTKDGVRIALGYPALHRTPSLDESEWVYWKNRFDTKVIEFDSRGTVKAIKD
jgi:hypothetical protein